MNRPFQLPNAKKFQSSAKRNNQSEFERIVETPHKDTRFSTTPHLILASNILESKHVHDWDILYCIDWLFSFILLLATLPIIILAMIWVMVIDFGPPIYCQQRMGLRLKSFTLYKIRTMRFTGTEARFCANNDTRILFGGTFIRKSRIDELPQLWNVILGDMALIGPRPEQLPFSKYFLEAIPNYKYRFLIKPGITGLAQITQGYVFSEEGTRRKLKLDLEYIKNRKTSLWLQIAKQTILVILTGFGAR